VNDQLFDGGLRANNRMALAHVDGVPVVWSALEGPVHARLTFRVGTCDEALTQRGITHIVEHLALSGLGSQAYQYNGQVTSTLTTFMALGSPEQVVAFLSHVCRSIHDLPVGRFNDEVRILQVESSRRELSQVDADLIIRYGAVGPGAGAWPEWGLFGATADAAQAWARTWFQRTNAVLTLTAAPPADLTLLLPDGPTPSHEPPPRDALVGRTWSPRQTKLVSVSIERTAGATPAGVVGMQAARERAFVALRERSAISYAVNLADVALGGGRLLSQLAADAQTSGYQEVLAQLSTAITAICTEGPDERELALAWDRFTLMAKDRSAIHSMLNINASRVRHRKELLQLDEFIEGYRAVTADDVVRQLSHSLDSELAIGPRELGGALPGWREASEWSTVGVAGDVFVAISGQEQGQIVVGPDGIMWKRHERLFRSVVWDRCAAVLCWPNGSRRIIGTDGSSVFAAPWAFRGWEPVDAAVDRRMPSGVQVWPDPATAPGPRDVPPPGAPITRPAQQTKRGRAAVTPTGWALLGGLAVLVIIAFVVSGSQNSATPIYAASVASIISSSAIRANARRRRRS